MIKLSEDEIARLEGILDTYVTDNPQDSKAANLWSKFVNHNAICQCVVRCNPITEKNKCPDCNKPLTT